MSEDYVAYAVSLGIFATGISMLALLDLHEVGRWAFGEKVLGTKSGGNDIEDIALTWRFAHTIMFLFAFVVFLAPVYVYVEVGEITYSDPAYRYTALAVALGILQISVILGLGYKISMLAMTKEEQWEKVSKGEKPVDSTGKIEVKGEIGWCRYICTCGGLRRSSVEQIMFMFQSATFTAFVIGCLVYFEVQPDAWHDDWASYLFFFTGILILLTHGVSWVGTKMSIGTPLSEDDLKNNAEFTAPLLQALLVVHGHKIPNFGDKVNEVKDGPDKNVLGNNGEVLSTLSPFGACTQVARTMTGNMKGNIYTRVVGGETYALTDGAVVDKVDDIVNRAHNGILQTPKTFSMSKGLGKIKDHKDYESAGRNADGYLRGELNLKKNATGPADVSQVYTRIHRNLDRSTTGVFSFYDFVWGFGNGIGLHINIPRSVVFPFVAFMLPMNIYFIMNVMYGIILWFITCFIPFLAALSGTFTQFWELFTYAFLITWSAVFLVRVLVPTGSSSYIYSADTWGNVDITTICGTIDGSPCTSWSESTTFSWACVVAFVLAVLMFLVESWKTFSMWGRFAGTEILYKWGNRARRFGEDLRGGAFVAGLKPAKVVVEAPR